MKALLHKLIREPLIHFVVLGAGLFVAWALTRDSAGERPNEIVVTAGRIEQLAETFARTWQRPPSPQELKGLIEDHIIEEILYREALALGLDRDDTIVRRRLRQKMDFLSEDFIAPQDPTEEELQAFLGDHPERFRVEAQVSFRHVYFSADRAEDNSARDIEHALQVLRRGVSAEVAGIGDPFLLQNDFERTRETDIATIFGEKFAKALLAVEPNEWAGPVESGYGRHLVFVRERIDERTPELAEVRDAVEREWAAAKHNEAKTAFYDALRERYEITIEMPSPSNPAAGVP